MKLKEWFNEFGKKVYSISEQPILTSTIVLIFVSILVLSLSLPYYRDNFYSFYGQVLAEAHGMIFDIAVIGILIFWLNKTGEKGQEFEPIKMKLMTSVCGNLRKRHSELLVISKG